MHCSVPVAAERNPDTDDSSTCAELPFPRHLLSGPRRWHPPPPTYITIIIDFACHAPMAYGASPPQRPSVQSRAVVVFMRPHWFTWWVTVWWYAIAATTCPDTREKAWTDDHYVSEAMGVMQCVNKGGINQTSSVSSVSDAGSWPRSAWTRSCVRPSSSIAPGFSTSSSSSSRCEGDRRIRLSSPSLSE